jgi:hypothetical protein
VGWGADGWKEAIELEKLRNSHEMGLQQFLEKFKAKQSQEYLNLKKRIASGRDELKKQRQQDLEK